MKEPLQPWIWTTIAILIFLCVPYFFAGTYEPLVCGLPLWFVVALFAALLLTGFTLYIVVCQWRLAAVVLEEEEH